MLSFLKDRFSQKLAIDLGTANTLVYQKGKGIVFRQPSVVARQKKDGAIVAVGEEAKKMVGKTPQAIEAFYPLHEGVIADFDAARAMIGYYLEQLTPEGKIWNAFFRPLALSLIHI